MMTSFAFIAGLVPLVIAEGAGMLSRRGVGTAVFGGMLAAALVGIFLIPMLYVVFQWMREKVKGKPRAPAADGGSRDAMTTPNRWKRYADWDERPLRLDKFAAEDRGQRLLRLLQPRRPKARTGSRAAASVVSLDGVLEHDFDMIDRFIARHHIDVGDGTRSHGDGLRTAWPACWWT